MISERFKTFPVIKNNVIIAMFPPICPIGLKLGPKSCCLRMLFSTWTRGYDRLPAVRLEIISFSRIVFIIVLCL